MASAIAGASPWRPLLLRPLAQLRVEEALALGGLATFWLLGRLHVTSFNLWTQFFREGLQLYLGLAALAVLVEVGRAVWQARAAPQPIRWLAGRIALAPLRFLRDWAPFVLLLTVYENLIWLVERVNPQLYDAALQRLDDLLLAGHTTFWFERWASAGRTEWFSLFYNVLYVYPVLVGGILYLLGRTATHRRWVLTFSLAGYLGFVGYLCVPAIGPGYYFEGVYRRDLSGRQVNMDLELLVRQDAAGPLVAASGGKAEEELAIYQLAQRLNRPSSWSGLIPRNCFPSLHTAWGLLILAFSWRHLRPLFWIVLFPVANLIAATVYLRFHYVVDLLAGAMLALLVLLLVPLVLAAEERLRRLVPGGGSRPAGDAPATAPPGLPARAARAGSRWRWLLLGSGGEQLARSSQQGRAAWLSGFGLPLLFFVATGLYLALAPAADGLVPAQRELLQANLLDELPAGITRRIGARFGDQLVLEGFSLEREEARPGEQLRMTSYWRLLRPLPPRWKVFVHVDGKVRVNRDHHPLFGALRLSDLPPGRIVRDPQLLWVDPALGRREVPIWMGIYDEQRVERRLPLGNPGEVVNDGHHRVRVATLRVHP